MRGEYLRWSHEVLVASCSPEKVESLRRPSCQASQHRPVFFEENIKYQKEISSKIVTWGVDQYKNIFIFSERERESWVHVCVHTCNGTCIGDISK